MERRWIVFLTVFLLLAGIGVLGLEYLGSTRVDPVVKDYRDTQARHLALYEEDQDFLAKFDIFTPVTEPKADAGIVLNSRLSWGPEPVPAQASTVLIPRELTEQVLRYRSDWMRHHSRLLKKNAIDFSLLQDLSKFDHWDIELNSPLARLIEAGKFVAPEKQPMPETLDLLTLAKLRLAQGAELRAPKDALDSIRHLARLLLTTENIHLFSSGLAMLDIERRAFRYFIDKGLMTERDWEPIPRNITRRASRAVWATRGYFHVWTEPSQLERIFLGEKPPVGFCAVINEAAPKELSLRPLLATKWPLERDFRKPYEIIDKAIARGVQTCRLRFLKRMVQLNRFETDFALPGFLTILPYSRKVFGLRIATLPFVGFEAYDDKDNPER